jgi:hypothetical protein
MDAWTLPHLQFQFLEIILNVANGLRSYPPDRRFQTQCRSAEEAGGTRRLGERKTRATESSGRLLAGLSGMQLEIMIADRKRTQRSPSNKERIKEDITRAFLALNSEANAFMEKLFRVFRVLPRSSPPRRAAGRTSR